MPSTLALCLCAAVTLWLFAKDARRRTNISGALWIPLVWIFIISSRPFSVWLAGGIGSEPAGDVLQDKFVDKALFLVLIGMGLVVLLKRRVNWGAILRHNKWLFVFFLYLGISALWSEDPIVSFKRWIKHFGNVVMVLVVLSDKDPTEAVKAFLARFAYLLIPFSVLVTKYYPTISRRYDIWTNQPAFIGMAMDKNTLGMSLFVCGLSLLWMLIELPGVTVRIKLREKGVSLTYGLLLLMTAWLLLKAHSATALSCTIVGAGVLMVLRVPSIRRRVKHLGGYIAGFTILVFVLEASGLGGLVVKESAALVGRDPTLHGRSDIWKAVLSEDTNPMVGAGFYSFWSPERNRRLSEKYYYSLGEAHNGYIETYLNSGLVGLFLLFAMIASAVSGIKRDVLNGSGLGTLRLGFLISTLMYNITESAFDRLVPVCFVLLFAVTGWSRKGNRSVQKMESKSPQPFVSPRSREKAGSSIIGQRLKCLHFSSLWRPFFACLVFVISFQRTQ